MLVFSLIVMPIDRLHAGLTHHATYTVTRDMSPPHLCGILATSRMISLIEDTCFAAVDVFLDEDQTTVGTHVDITHVAAARTGETLRINVRLVKVTQQRLLRFEVTVEASAGVISTGSHQRLVVDRSTFIRT
jgi:fluoroacetyl-CoA thioesterase